MALKSVIDVDINDSRFREFSELFKKYSDELSKNKSKWQETNKEATKLTSTFGELSAALLTIATMQKKITDEENKQEDHSRKTSNYWRDIVRGTREVAANVASTTKNLLAWGAIGTAFSGLLGAGSLFGLDRLAVGVGSARRSALGLGISYGEQQAFGLNYGRVIDAGGFLGNVQESLQDVTKRQALYGAGLTESDLRGKDAAQVAALLIPRLKSLADRTPPQLLGQVLQARGLSQLLSLQDFERLRNTPGAELASYGRSFTEDSKKLGISPGDQAVWQDFAVRLARTGRLLETTFVKGLGPLIKPLDHLSQVLASTLATSLDRLARSGAIDKIGRGLENFAGWIGSDDFQSKVKMFTDDIVALGGAVHRALQYFGVVPSDKGAAPPITHFQDRLQSEKQDLANSPGGKFNKAIGDAIQHGASVAQHYLTFGAYPINNPGNLRPVGAATGFRQFNTIEDGVRALAADLQYKQKNRHLDTLQDIIARYAPKGENNTAAYIRDVSQRTGIAAGAHLNLSDVRELARVMAAMVHHENSKTKLTEPVILKILQSPGANTVVSSNQLAGQK